MRAAKAVGIVLLLICSAFRAEGNESAQETVAKDVYNCFFKKGTDYKHVIKYKDAPEHVPAEIYEAIAKVIEQSKLAKNGYKISVVVSSKFAPTISNGNVFTPSVDA